MNEAIKKWKEETLDAKTVQKSDILEYLAFSYYSQVQTNQVSIIILVSNNNNITINFVDTKPNYKCQYFFLLGGYKKGIILHQSAAGYSTRSSKGCR